MAQLKTKANPHHDPMAHDYVRPPGKTVLEPCSHCGYDLEHHRDRSDYIFARHAGGWYKPDAA